MIMNLQKIILALGTVNGISIWDTSGEKANHALCEIERLILDADKRLSIFRPDSEISKLNACAGKKVVNISPETLEILSDATKMQDGTNGAFDVTKGAGHNALILDAEEHTAFLKKKGIRVDLGGIAKGYVADQVRRILSEEGISNALINLGGTVVCHGVEREVEIRNPMHGSHSPLLTISSRNEIIATSGTYERGAHIWDPRTGKNAETDLIAVTVIGENGADTDALATACMVLGLRESASLLQKRKESAIFVLRSGGIFVTERLRNQIVKKGA